MTSATLCRIWIAAWTGLCLCSGCDESAKPTPPIETGAQGAEPHQKSEQPVVVSSPKVLVNDKTIELVDLNLMLRKVSFDPPIDGAAYLFFSETEISNAMYAAYLADTKQIRDDSDLEKQAKARITSTGGTMLTIRKPASLWRNGKIPAGRESHPVSFVTIAEGMKFCAWLNARYELSGLFRLPTDTEWLFAAYGVDRSYPWGNEERKWTGLDTEAVLKRPELKTPDGLYGMWGNVAELVLSDSDGYGGTIKDKYKPMITSWQGTSYSQTDSWPREIKPRQNYWGYTHSSICRSDTWGFRIVFAPKGE